MKLEGSEEFLAQEREFCLGVFEGVQLTREVVWVWEEHEDERIATLCRYALKVFDLVEGYPSPETW